MIFQLNTVATLFTKDKSPFLNLTSKIIIFRVTRLTTVIGIVHKIIIYILSYNSEGSKLKHMIDPMI